MGKLRPPIQRWLRSPIFVAVACITLLLVTLVTYLAQIEVPQQLWTQEVAEDGAVNLAPRQLTPYFAEFGTPVTGVLTVISLTSTHFSSKKADARISADLATTQRELEIEKLKAQLSITFRSLFTSIAQLKDGLELNDFTVRLYCKNASQRLEHFVDIRHHNRPPSNIEWKPGMGCLGNAWNQNEVKTLNLARTERNKALKTPESWTAADPEMTQGLDRSDALKLQERPYKGIAAHPISCHNQVVGVLVIDMPEGFYRFLRTDQNLIQTVELHIELSRNCVADLDRHLAMYNGEQA